MEIVCEAAGVFVKQELHAIGVFRGDDEAHVMPLVEPPEDLRVCVRRGTGILLARQGDENTTIVLLMLRQLVY